MDQVAENEVILAYRFLIVLLGYTLLYFVRSLIIYNDSMLFFYSHVQEAQMVVLFWHIIYGSHNMFRLPPSMLDKPNKVQRVQCAHEPRLHMHLPFFFLVYVTVVALPSISSRSKVTPLVLDDLRERFVPIVHVDHPPCLEVAPEEDARVRKLPYGQALGHRVIAGQRKESVGLEKCRNDGGARSGIYHLLQSPETVVL